MTQLIKLSNSAVLAALLSAVCFSSALAQTPAPAPQASLSVQGRPTVYGSVLALRAKTLNENRIVVIATLKPLTAKQFEQVQKANAEETKDLDGYPSYIKASFTEDGTLRYLVGDGGGAVFSKKNEPSQNALQGKATIIGDRVKGEVSLNEPGEYSKVAKITFDLPIVTEAPPAPTAPPTPARKP
jgi:hypothetical protein